MYNQNKMLLINNNNPLKCPRAKQSNAELYGTQKRSMCHFTNSFLDFIKLQKGFEKILLCALFKPS